jgi:hypothetical protein
MGNIMYSTGNFLFFIEHLSFHALAICSTSVSAKAPQTASIIFPSWHSHFSFVFLPASPPPAAVCLYVVMCSLPRFAKKNDDDDDDDDAFCLCSVIRDFLF